jgi:hypothetical protein
MWNLHFQIQFANQFAELFTVMVQGYNSHAPNSLLEKGSFFSVHGKL